MATRLTDAQAVLGSDLLGLNDIAVALGTTVEAFDPRVRHEASEVPMTKDELSAARQAGELVIFRIATDEGQPLTINRLIERFPAAFDQKLLAKCGYLLRDEWGITLEPVAQTQSCKTGWATVRKATMPETRNRSYFEQDAILTSVSPGWRRRTTPEAAYDLVLYYACRGIRLLASDFDWTSSATADGGFLNVGGFQESGMQIVSFSAAVRHAGLGVCPTRSPG